MSSPCAQFPPVYPNRETASHDRRYMNPPALKAWRKAQIPDDISFSIRDLRENQERASEADFHNQMLGPLDDYANWQRRAFLQMSHRIQTQTLGFSGYLLQDLRWLRWPSERRYEPGWRPQMAGIPESVTSFLELRGNRVLNRTFPSFCLLPEETRKKIWAQAIADDPRVFEMRHPDLLVYKDQNQDLVEVKRGHCLIKPRALASACLESRMLFSEVCLGDTFYLINFDADTIYFGPESYRYHQILWRPEPSPGEDEAEPELQVKQQWNHWRCGHNDLIKGQEQLWNEPYQNLEQHRRSSDPYHPFLSDSLFEIDRSQIKNVAFDLEFWRETERRCSVGQIALMSTFPCAERFILAAGDVGESLDLKRTDHGDGMEVVYKSRVISGLTAPPGVKYSGQVEFHSGARQERPSFDAGINVAATGGHYPKPIVMCVTRGSKYYGHPSRFQDGWMPGLCSQAADDDDDDDEDDEGNDHEGSIRDSRLWDQLDQSASYTLNAKEEERDIMEELLEDRSLDRKIPSDAEVEYLQNPETSKAELEDLPDLSKALHTWTDGDLRFSDLSMEERRYLTELRQALHTEAIYLQKPEVSREELPYLKARRRILHHKAVKAAQAFHASVPDICFADYDSVEEPDDAKDEAENDAKDDGVQDGAGNAVENNVGGLIAIDDAVARSTRLANPEARAAVNKPTKSAYQCKPLKNPPKEGEQVGRIRDSLIKYGKLCYLVTWENVYDGTRRECKEPIRKEAAYLNNDRARDLMKDFHLEHPEKPDQKSEHEYERSKWGLKTGRVAAHAAGPSSLLASSTSPALSEQDAEWDLMDIDEEADGRVEAASRASSELSDPPSSLFSEPDWEGQEDEGSEDVLPASSPSPPLLEQDAEWDLMDIDEEADERIEATRRASSELSEPPSSLFSEPDWEEREDEGSEDVTTVVTPSSTQHSERHQENPQNATEAQEHRNVPESGSCFEEPRASMPRKRPRVCS